MTNSQIEIEKMMARFRRVCMRVDLAGDDLFCVFGGVNDDASDWSLTMAPIQAPGGRYLWTMSQLYNLLALIFTHGRPSNYKLTLRTRGQTARFKMNIMIPAGADPFEIANDLASCRQCVVHALWRVEK